MTVFEKKLRTEDSDIAEIMTGILHSQAKFAAKEKRELARGTHAKGVCVRGTFEVFDLTRTVDDAELRSRLARGAFAKPGVYDAVVRFANGASTISPDDKPDVRALSFSVALPAATEDADDDGRRDFAMNNATTFPINDVHAFAVLMRLKSAEGAWGKLKALVTVSPVELWGVVKTAVRGIRQQRQKIAPYQTTRYWSNTAFQHGPDAAVKYSAMPGSGNPAHSVDRGLNILRDELLRHVTSDEPMSYFDIGVQFLDVQRMRHRLRKRAATFWTENASVEWKEKQAPFHVVARLTLVHGSQLIPEECAQQYIDVNEHRAPESKPLGSINRGRWYAEAASRSARLGLPVPAGLSMMGANTQPQSWVGRITIGSLLRMGGLATLLLVGLITLFAGATSLYLHWGGKMLPEENVEFVAYPDQGWGAGVEAADRQTFYYTGQGAGLKGMRYSWFAHLEMPWGKARFVDALNRYGFLLDGETKNNPDRLPVGLTKHYDKELNETLLDITCATCHTGQIQVTRNGQTRAMRIDGGQAGHAFTDTDFGNFLPTLIASMTNTLVNPFKFRRFAQRVLGPSYPTGAWTLHGEMRGVLGTLLGVGFTEKSRKLIPTQEGYGRTDALTRIANTVFGEHLVPTNYAIGTGPVSYPPLWNIWKFDWVQYSASVSQPMARNIGESMGVGTRYSFMDRYGRPLPLEERFRATALIDNLHTIETTLRRLKSPAWREDLLGPVIAARAEAGLALFNQHCEGCHGPHIAPEAIKVRNSPLKTADDPEWLIPSLCVNDIGTDPHAATNWVRSVVDITRTGLTAPELRDVARRTLEQWNQRQGVYLRGEIDKLRARTDAPSVAQRNALEQELAGMTDAMEQSLSQIDPARLSVGAALSYLGTMIREKAYDDAGKTAAERADLDGFGILDMPRVAWVYKPRPLAGAWASPPFLHNGSVPTVYDLLSPVQDRPVTFRAGSREYDPEWLGLYDPTPRGPRKGQPDPTRPDREQMNKFWLFDTAEPGNSNSGHEFGAGYDERRGDQQVRPGLIGPPLTHDERMAIIEHLKVRDDDRDGLKEPKIPHEPTCTLPERTQVSK